MIRTQTPLAAVHLPEAIAVAEVVMDAREAGGAASYTYENTVAAQVGQAVVVPLGNRASIGFVVSLKTVSESQLGFPRAKLRSIESLIEGVRLPEAVMELLHWTADSTLTKLSQTISLSIPPGLNERLVRRWTLVRELNAEDFKGLTPAQNETLRVIQEQTEVIDSKAKPIAPAIKKQLRMLKASGLVHESMALMLHQERYRLSGYLKLTGDDKKIEAFLSRQGQRRPAQAMAIMRLQGASAATFSAQEVKALSGATDAAIKGLLQAGLLEQVEQESHRRTTPPEPNPDQARAIQALKSAIQKGDSTPTLLFGVTGSGKTEVFLQSAAEALRLGKKVLYLVPEITLTAQVIAQLRGRFGKGVAIVHSNLSTGDRMANWLAVARGEAAVVLGARSALYAPIDNLGLIIVDEEHEASYKQEVSPRYHARDGAIRLAEIHGCPVVLGSATPSVESYYFTEQGRYRRLELPNRTATAKLPEVFVQDLTELYKDGKPSIFGPILSQKIRETLKREEQIILFLNRRAFAPFLICRECGHRWACADCAVTLSYHKRSRVLKCHHCGHLEPVPDQCPSCQGTRIAPFGTGSERVEEAVREMFPTVGVARLDRDITEKKGALEDILTQFRSGSLQILVGTQMVAKGLDFPNVTLVGVIAADISLNLPDFRAAERTFGLLSQVAGRAGRGTRPGEVVIQTASPDNIAIQTAVQHDYLSLYRVLIQERQEAEYPPFCTLVNVVASGEMQSAVESVIAELAHRFQKVPGLTVLGPVECPLERLNGLWRYHVMLKLPKPEDVRWLVPLLDSPDPKRVHLTVDVNPYSMM